MILILAFIFITSALIVLTAVCSLVFVVGANICESLVERAQRA